MILVDANLLIYAYDRTNPYHERARSWLENVFSASEPVAISWINILAFLRITTNSRLFEKPFSIAEAAARVDEWLEQPNVVILEPGREHWTILRDLLTSADIKGPPEGGRREAALGASVTAGSPNRIQAVGMLRQRGRGDSGSCDTPFKTRATFRGYCSCF
ncbi:MAG: type II toxin-antitoxin system VapC family toxin [bacterium]|nr:type II toxin-antitoxin system VapC family toxin [bacterium]